MTNKQSHIQRFIDHLLEERLKEGDVVVDATLGRGNDTLKIAKIIGNSGKIFAFDVQESAIDKSKDLLFLNNISSQNIYLINDSHERVLDYIDEKVDFAIMNLGYLPGSDKTIHTQARSTIAFIKSIINLLGPSGTLVISFYPGSQIGKNEMDKVMDYLKKVDQKLYNVYHINFINQINNPPELVVLEKKHG